MKIFIPNTLSILCIGMAFIPCTVFCLNNTYTVGPKDILSIDVWGEPDLTKEFVITQDGTIDYPLLGNISIAGLSTKQIDEKITHAIKNTGKRDLTIVAFTDRMMNPEKPDMVQNTIIE